MKKRTIYVRKKLFLSWIAFKTIYLMSFIFLFEFNCDKTLSKTLLISSAYLQFLFVFSHSPEISDFFRWSFFSSTSFSLPWRLVMKKRFNSSLWTLNQLGQKRMKCWNTTMWKVCIHFRLLQSFFLLSPCMNKKICRDIYTQATQMWNSFFWH